jgi:hypothetical protein
VQVHKKISLCDRFGYKDIVAEGFLTLYFNSDLPNLIKMVSFNFIF